MYTYNIISQIDYRIARNETQAVSQDEFPLKLIANI